MHVKLEDREAFRILEDGELHLQKPLYEVYDVGNYWGLTMEDHLTGDIYMIATTGEQALFTEMQNSGVVRICRSYVDDSFNAGTFAFGKLSETTLAKFDTRARLYGTFHFNGGQIHTLELGSFEISQRYFINSSCQVDKNATFEEFRRHLALLSWVFYTRPDVTCRTSQLA